MLRVKNQTDSDLLLRSVTSEWKKLPQIERENFAVPQNTCTEQKSDVPIVACLLNGRERAETNFLRCCRHVRLF